MAGRLEGKVCVILGASDGRNMGGATARRFVKEGAKVIVAARRADRVQALAGEIGALGLTCDITKEDQIEALFARAIRDFGKVDVAINYTGVDAQAPITDVTREMLQQSCDVHFIGALLFMKHAARNMKEGGSIINTSSMTAYTTPEGLTSYAGAKRGADQAVRIAACELGPRGIRVNVIIPGFTRSEMTEGYFALPNLEKAFVNEIPLKRLGVVEDMANTALWLASDESRSTTGQAIDVTSGQSMRRTPTGPEIMGG
jgi:NAD(P)-dependent dehydrogenase (short-subunit alcohol dehydrogenase family)